MGLNGKAPVRDAIRAEHIASSENAQEEFKNILAAEYINDFMKYMALEQMPDEMDEFQKEFGAQKLSEPRQNHSTGVLTTLGNIVKRVTGSRETRD